MEDRLNRLPKGWVWTKLGDIGIVASGGTPSTKDESNFRGNIPWITPADLSNFQTNSYPGEAEIFPKKG